MVTTSDWLHQTVLVAEPTSASRARDFVCLHLAEHSLLYLVEDIRLVVSELATNAMVHARTPFTVTLSADDRTVLLAVRDGSTTVPVKAGPQVTDMRGRGLLLVEQLSLAWGASTAADGSKSVWASFATRSRPGAWPAAGPQ
ncbi:MAG TPA: ATP-binding protein [Nocardioidaceae bacterium]|nr:ATP-binding protein [Nocardioidaceae bacterium]